MNGERVTCLYRQGNMDSVDTCTMHKGAVCELELDKSCQDYEPDEEVDEVIEAS